jgi:hypothetical protein
MFFMGSEFSAKPKWLFSHGTDAAMAVAAEAPFPMAATKQRW